MLHGIIIQVQCNGEQGDGIGQADVLANIGLQSDEIVIHIDQDCVRSAAFLQCHSDGGFLIESGWGSWGFTLCKWQHDDHGNWCKELAGYGYGRFQG